MSAPTDRIVVFPDHEGKWRWYYQAAGNHRVMADSGQGYSKRSDAIDGAHRVTHCALVDPTHPNVAEKWVLPLHILDARGGAWVTP